MSRPKGSKNKPKEPVQEEVNAPEEVIAPVATPAYRARTALIEDIVAHNKELREEADREEQTENTEIAEEQTETQSQENIQEPPKTEVPAVAKYNFVVDGEKLELTEDEIRERIQKSAAAEKRLAEATRLLEDAKRQAATLHEKPPQPPVKPSSETDDAEFIQSAAKALLYGDEEQVTQTIKAILGKGRSDPTQSGITPERVASYVDEKLAFRDGMRLLETPPEQGGYADVYSDPVLKARFHQREAELRDVQQDKRPYVELYKSIGEEIRAWRDNLIKQHVPQTGLEDRDTLKAATGVVRGAGGKIPAPQVSAPKSALERHEAEIDRQRRARGLN